MFVIATAGHVDHGKSTLVRALTGMEPDRWEQEKQRGLTIDLGFAWSELPSGRSISFVDVPGHERFIGNMLAGLGPVPIVMFVVAADEGWREQSSDHRDAVAALGIEHGIIVVTRADLADQRAQQTLEQARRELAGTALAQARGVIVSSVTGHGIAELREALDDLTSRIAPPDPTAAVRVWIDRSFTIAGAGTVVTGTLGAGTITGGDELELVGSDRSGTVAVRAVQSRGHTHDRIEPVSRAAINLRQIEAGELHRGDALITPGAFRVSSLFDVRATHGTFADAPRQALIHVGTASMNAFIRPLGPRHARMSIARALPLRVGDRLVIRGSGEQAVFAGARIVDVDPPQLRRRGEGRARADALESLRGGAGAEDQVRRRGVVARGELERMGIDVSGIENIAGIAVSGDLLVSQDFLETSAASLLEATKRSYEEDPLNPGLGVAAARSMLGIDHADVLALVVKRAGLRHTGSRVVDPTRTVSLGQAEHAVSRLEKQLQQVPFTAPEAGDLAQLGLGPKEIAAAHAQGRLLRLAEGIVVLPSAPARAMRELAALPQPFTTSQARAALGSTRRTVIPLLEYLDARGWTRRIDAGHREVVR